VSPHSRLYWQPAYRGCVDELTDSSGLAGDAVKLRQRLAGDGYLFFRGLLPADQVLAAGTVVWDRLCEGGWTDPDGMLAGQQRAVNPSDALSDPAFRAAVMSAEFNRIPYLPPLRRMVREVLGRTAFSFPVKVLRAVYPERLGTRPRGRYIHYDYGSGGGQDMLTSWIPLMEIPLRLGGLAVQPGGQYWPPKWPRRPRPLTAAEPGWASTDYRPGDVIVFHCLTPHAALPNTTTVAGQASLRLSGDFRWQLPDKPVPTEMVLGPLARRPEGSRPPELFFRLFGNQPWWEPIPPGLVLRPRAELAAIPPRPRGSSPSIPAGKPGSPHPSRPLTASRFSSRLPPENSRPMPAGHVRETPGRTRPIAADVEPPMGGHSTATDRRIFSSRLLIERSDGGTQIYLFGCLITRHLRRGCVLRPGCFMVFDPYGPASAVPLADLTCSDTTNPPAGEPPTQAEPPQMGPVGFGLMLHGSCC